MPFLGIGNGVVLQRPRSYRLRTTLGIPLTTSLLRSFNDGVSPHLLVELLLGFCIHQFNGELRNLESETYKALDTRDIIDLFENLLVKRHILELYRLLVCRNRLAESPYRNPLRTAIDLATHVKEIVVLLVEGCSLNLDKELIELWELNNVTVIKLKASALTLATLRVAIVLLNVWEGHR